jgi:Ca-activated chloride channel homolog
LHHGSQENAVVKIGAVSIAVLVALISAAAQERVAPLPPPDDQGHPVFRSSASVVALNVAVSNPQKKFVTGLSARDFEVYEDGVQQELSFFETADVPIDVILLLDVSSSMRDRMPVVHEAARNFMKVLRNGDRGAVLAFSQHVRILQTPTSDPAAIAAAINSTSAEGATALFNAIYVALKEFGQTAQTTGQVRRKAIVVLSDGEDTSSLIAFEDVLDLARRSGVNIYTIALQSQQAAHDPKADRAYFSGANHAMRTLASETGAQSFFPADVQSLSTVYSTIAAELEAQYSLAYAPRNAQADGSFRRILVRVPSDPSLRPRARTGYTAVPARANNELTPQLR